MTNNVITRLLRVLELEEKQNWRNRSVIGGLLAMGERWQADAITEQMDDNLVQVILGLMAHYETVSQQLRPAVASKIRAVLQGEVEDIEALLDEFVGDRAPKKPMKPTWKRRRAPMRRIGMMSKWWKMSMAPMPPIHRPNQPMLPANGCAANSANKSVLTAVHTICKLPRPFSPASARLRRKI